MAVATRHHRADCGPSGRRKEEEERPEAQDTDDAERGTTSGAFDARLLDALRCMARGVPGDRDRNAAGEETSKARAPPSAQPRAPSPSRERCRSATAMGCGSGPWPGGALDERGRLRPLVYASQCCVKCYHLQAPMWHCHCQRDNCINGAVMLYLSIMAIYRSLRRDILLLEGPRGARPRHPKRGGQTPSSRTRIYAAPCSSARMRFRRSGPARAEQREQRLASDMSRLIAVRSLLRLASVFAGQDHSQWGQVQ